MDRLDELAIFVAIVEAGSLAGAARRLRRSTAAVTRALAALEARVGARLIDRTTRRLAVTAAGRTFAERARALAVDYAAAMGDAAEGQARGLVRVTAPSPFGRRYVMPIVTVFLEAHPAMQVELVLDDRNLDLVEHGIDVALHIGELGDSSLKARRVGSVSTVLVASPDYLKANGTPRSPADLAGHAAIFGGSRAGMLEWRFGTARDAVVKLAPRLLVNDVDARLLAARAGHGIARVLSYQAADGLADGTLVRLLREQSRRPCPCSSSVAPVRARPRSRPFSRLRPRPCARCRRSARERSGVQLAMEELAHQRGDLRRMGLQREMAGVEKMNLGIGDVARVGLRALRQEERICSGPRRRAAAACARGSTAGRLDRGPRCSDSRG